MQNLDFIDYLNTNERDIITEEKEELINGLKNSNQKKINPKYFYDQKGSILFEKITKSDDYYPTKKEMEILDQKNKKIKKELPAGSSIIEFGAGSNKKIKKLLEILDSPSEYISIDISKDFLLENTKKLAKEFPNLKITAISADFNHKFEFQKIKSITKPKIGFFPGSTIGNFSKTEARKTLIKFRKNLESNNFLVIGVDLKKDKTILEKAYNDSEGITAKFNKNIFKNLNNRYGFNFDENKFDHKAFFNSKKSRVEMHLISKVDHSVRIFDEEINFITGESIHTENSYKYTYESFEILVQSAGYKIQKFYSDEKSFFGIFILKVKE